MVVVLGACADDVVGEWNASTGYCSNDARDHFTIEDDLTGTGELVMRCADGSGPALSCPAAMTAIERQSQNRWQLEADMGDCGPLEQYVGRAYKECQLRSDGTELRCCNPDGSNCLTYTRAD